MHRKTYQHGQYLSAQESLAKHEVRSQKRARKARVKNREALKKKAATNLNQINWTYFFLTSLILSESVVASSVVPSASFPQSSNQLNRLSNFYQRPICKTNTTICMEGQRLSEQQIANHSKHLLATIVDRRNSNNPDKPLLKAVQVEAIIHAGNPIDILAVTGLASSVVPTTSPKREDVQELELHAEWKNSTIEKASAGKGANVFGSSGVFLVSSMISSVQIPKMKADAVPKELLTKYKAELIPLDQSFYIEPTGQQSIDTLYVIKYEFAKEYVDQYVLQMNGGGGVFIERHPFTQFFTPLAKECSGGIILGIEKANQEYQFASFEIPFGYTLKINPMAIHGNSFFVGPYATALTDSPADTVLFRKDNADREIVPVEHVSVATANSQHRLFKQVREQKPEQSTVKYTNQQQSSFKIT